MPLRKVKVSYTKARRTPSKRIAPKQENGFQDFIPPLRVPTGLTPLARYIIENEDSGLPVQELIEQFQEYDCEHSSKFKVITGHKEIFTCEGCGLVEIREVRQ